MVSASYRVAICSQLAVTLFRYYVVSLRNSIVEHCLIKIFSITEAF